MDILVHENKSLQLDMVSEFKSAIQYLATIQGIEKEKVSNQLLLGIYEIVTTRYKRIAPNEIKRAFEMAFSGKLKLSDKDLECYGSIKVTYVTKILDAYLKFRDIEKYELLEATKDIEKTPNQKMDLQIFTAKRVILNAFILKGYNPEYKTKSYPLIVQFWHYDILLAMELITVSAEERTEILKNQRELYKPKGDLTTMRDVPLDKAKVITVGKQFDLWIQNGFTTKELKESFRLKSRNFYAKILTNRV